MRAITCSALAVASLACALQVVACGDQPSVTRNRPSKDGSPGRVIYNLDCSEFFVETFGPIAPETIDRFVDEHAALGITDLFINVNAKRTNYRSEVWESEWDGYDPALGDDQPFFAASTDARDRQHIRNVYSLYKQGCDYGSRMIDASRRNGVRPWISLRMNDDHNPGIPEHHSHSTLWKNHPQWRLVYGLDFEQPEVREHYMKLVREVCLRYDMDGLELDFLRFPWYFRKDHEHEGAKLMTAFVARIRTLTEAAAKRLGHPVELAVRVPSTPWISRRMGHDAVAWARSGLVDMIIAGGWYQSADGDVPIENWKGSLIGTDVTVAYGVEQALDSGGSGLRSMSPDEMRGIFTSAWHRGADAVYLFNMFTTPYHNWPRETHNAVVRDAGSWAALRTGPRRHALTIISPWMPGESNADRMLPYTGTRGIFRIHSGPKPGAEQRVQIELVTDNYDVPLEVRLNGVVCSFVGVTDHRHSYSVPPEASDEGYNLIEVSAKTNVKLTWVEVSVQ